MWKAIVAVGSALCGIMLFFNIYQVYIRCFRKPKNFIKPEQVDMMTNNPEAMTLPPYPQIS